jgi:hypothetical protein
MRAPAGSCAGIEVSAVAIASVSATVAIGICLLALSPNAVLPDRNALFAQSAVTGDSQRRSWA